jgi:NAD-dependent deacetylase
LSRIVILTGAGVSAESGLGTFRDKGGLWTRYDLSEVATPEGFARNPRLVHDFYNARRANALDAEPNAAHEALARLTTRYSGEILLVTQNIDDLHERGAPRVSSTCMGKSPVRFVPSARPVGTRHG